MVCPEQEISPFLHELMFAYINGKYNQSKKQLNTNQTTTIAFISELYLKMASN